MFLLANMPGIVRWLPWSRNWKKNHTASFLIGPPTPALMSHSLKSFPGVDAAFFPLDFEAAFGLRPNPKGVMTRSRVRQGEIETDSAMGGMSRGAASDLVYPATLAERVVKRAVERLADETKRVQEVALARAILADEEDERAKTH